MKQKTASKLIPLPVLKKLTLHLAERQSPFLQLKNNYDDWGR